MMKFCSRCNEVQWKKIIVLFVGFVLFPKITAQEILPIEIAVQRGLLYSFDLQSRNIQIAIASGQLRNSIRNFLPQLQLSITNSDSVTYGGPDNHSIQMNAKITQPVYDGGRFLIQRTLGQYQLQLQQVEYQNMEKELRTMVWSQYHQLLVLGKQIEIQQEALIRSQSQLAILRLEAAQGSTTNLELLNGEIAIKQQELDISSRIIEYNSASDSFKRILHIPTSTKILLIDTGIENYSGGNLPWSIEQLKSLALSSNIEYQSSQITLQQNLEEYALSKRTYIPTINLDISVGATGQGFPLTTPTFNLGLSFQFDDPTIPSQSSLNAGRSSSQNRTRSSSFSLSPFQQIGSNLSKRQAELSIQQALKTINDLEYTIPEQIYLLSEQYQQKQNALEIQRDLLSLEYRRLQVLEVQLNQGTIKRIDFLEAQTQITKQEIALLQSVLELLQVEWGIASSLGIDPDILKTILENSIHGVSQ